ncbi:hypothetical protein [Paenibacillus elgii]|uniref:hypothetical protein n=1 Tax=Paenibacillus elgii TaxID=189691 RepID=UPI00203A707D|nr:hypothetical protein [Paenibacillus elgii]MCM3269470.1 hypothetical protein [Paenibacillus elgii]
MKKIASLALLAALSVVSIVPAASAEQIQPREVNPSGVKQAGAKCKYVKNVTRAYSKESAIKETITYVDGGCYGDLSKVDVKQSPPVGWMGLTPVGETGIKTPCKSKQPVVGNEPATGYLVSFECELSYSK